MSSIQLYPTLGSQTYEKFAFQKISRKSNVDLVELSVLETLNQSGFVKVTESASFDFPNFPETEKSFQVIYFGLDADLQGYQALFRSIVSLGKPAGVILEINKELSNYTLKFYSDNSTIVKSYLKKIFGFLDEEIRFKAILRKVLEIQFQAKMEEQLLTKELFFQK